MKPTYPSGDDRYFVYYTMEENRWVIVAVHRLGEARLTIPTPRVVVKAVDELGAFQEVNTWLQKLNVTLSTMTPAL